MKGHSLGTRAFGELWPSPSQGQGWSQSLVGDRVTGTHRLGAALQSGTQVVWEGTVAPGSGRVRVRARAGDTPLSSLFWGGRGWGLDQSEACSAREMGWAGAGHCHHPSTSLKPSPHLPLPSICRCSPLPPVTEGASHLAVPIARAPSCPPTSQCSLILGSLVPQEEGSVPAPHLPKGLERGQRQFCLKTPGLKLASSLGESQRERRLWEASGTGRWEGSGFGRLLEDGFVLEQ